MVNDKLNLFKDEKVNITLRIERELLDRVDSLSNHFGKSRNKVLNALIELALKNVKLGDIDNEN